MLIDLVFRHDTASKGFLTRTPEYFDENTIGFVRPHYSDFLQFCFKVFSVAVWSSRKRKNLEEIVDFLFGERKKDLLFTWDQSKCTDAGYHTVDNINKRVFLKEITRVWTKFHGHDESNTLLLDDSPYKALANPENTGIFPDSYRYQCTEDMSLGLNGDIRNYLEKIYFAKNVRQYVQEHPFGQDAITKEHPHWSFYSEIKGVSGTVVDESCDAME